MGGVQGAELSWWLIGAYLALMLALTISIAFLPDVVLFLPELLVY